MCGLNIGKVAINYICEKYGKDSLALVASYRQKHGIDRVKLPDVKDDAGKKTSSEKLASGSK